MSSDIQLPSRLYTIWSWVWWVALLAAVPVQAVVIGAMMYGAVGTFRSVGSPLGSPPGTPPPPPSPREAAGDAAADYLTWLPLTQVVLVGVVVALPNRVVKNTLRPFHLWVWIPLASILVAWFLSSAGRDGIYMASF